MKRARLTLVLFVVLAALGAYVYFHERGEAPEGPVALRFDPKRVTEIRIKDAAGDLIRLTRKGEAWRLVEPVKARADKEVVTQLLDDLKLLADQGEIGKQVKDLKPYGLEKPRATLTIVRRGKSRLVLLVGRSTPDSTNAYARLQGTARVFMVQAAVADQIARRAAEFRDKSVLAFEIPKVRRLQLVRAGARVAAERPEKGDWRLTEPLKTPADTFAMEDLIAAAHDLKAAEFVSEKPRDRARFGLDKPQLELRLWTGARQSSTIRFGKQDPIGRIYAGTSEGPAVVAVAQADFDNLNKTAADLRSKKVLSFDEDQVTRLAIESPAGGIEIARQGPAKDRRWEIVKPAKAAADDRSVEDALYALSGLQAEEFIDSPGRLADYALDAPRLRAVLTITGRKTPLTLLVGREATAEPGVFVKRADAPTVYRVSATILADLFPDVERFRSRQVLKLDRDAIERIALEHGKTRVVVERRGEDRWQITSPKKAEADPGKLAAILFTLEDLRGDALAAAAPTDLAPYGLDKPRLTVEIGLKGRAQPERLLVGKAAEGGRVFIKRESAKEVYLKDRYLLDELRKTPDDLKK